MILRRYYITMFLLALLAMPRVVFAAEALSDDEAYSRAYSYCHSRVSPMWSPKPGEKVPKRTSADRERNKRLTVECMKKKGVPVRYDMTTGITRTGKGFGQDVHIDIKEIFPANVLSPKTIAREKPEISEEVKSLPLPALDKRELLPPDMRAQYDVDSVDLEQIKGLVSDSLWQRLKRGSSGAAASSGGSTDSTAGYEYNPPEKESAEVVEKARVVADEASLPKKMSVSPKDEKVTAHRPSPDDTETHDDVSASGNENDQDGYQVKPIFLGR